jgi:poly(3-hydroxybutyrate) depolymerase
MTIFSTGIFSTLLLAWSGAALESNSPEVPQSLTDTICANRPRTRCEVELDVPEACATTSNVSDDPSCPIVFFLHGSGGTNNWYARTTDVHEAGYIGVYPQGEGGWNTDPKTTNTCDWSEYDCTTDPDEGDYIASIIAEIRAKGGSGNVYAIGNSNGAALAHRLAANAGSELPIKGIVVKVTQLLASPNRSGPGGLNYNQPSADRGSPAVSVLSLLGTDDDLIPYDGGSSIVFNGDTSFQLMSALNSMETWAAHNGCDGSLPVSSEHSTDQGTFTATKYDYSSGCPSGVYVEHYAIHDAGHDAGGATIDDEKIDYVVAYDFIDRVEGRTGGEPPSDSCVDDPTWAGKFNSVHTCDYVASNPANRCSWENSDGVGANDACPEACNTDCSLDESTASPVAKTTSSPVASPVASPPSDSCVNDPTWAGSFFGPLAVFIAFLSC